MKPQTKATNEAGRHTPGPWTAECFDSDGTFAVMGPTKHDLFYSVSNPEDATHPNSNDDAREANARLIAAAPDMLEALKLLQAALTEYRLRDVKKHYSLCVADAAASNAIHKAEKGE